MGWDTHPVFVIRGGDGQENEGLDTADPIPSTATGFFYQLTDPVYSTDAHTYRIVLPFDGKRALICLKLMKMVSEKGLE